jgi:mono/diheme cytochrome c family protein
VLHNPGAILMFTYGEGGNGLGFSPGPATIDARAGEAPADSGPQEWEDPETAGTEQAGGDRADAGDASASVTAGSNVSEVAALGAPKYAVYCAMCHGPTGRGGAGAVLAENDQLADDGFVATAVVHGFGYMPGFGGRLGDNDIAEVSTYVRNNWGNEFGVLTTEQVSEVR